MRTQIGQLGGLSKEFRSPPRRAPKSCRPTNEKKRSEPRRERSRSPKFSKKMLLFCVRLSDGYYFPTPNSQFVGRKDAERQLERCSAICGGAEMDLFILENRRKETADMVSTKDGRSYSEMPSAYRYREESSFLRCNFQQYKIRVAAARDRRGRLSDEAVVIKSASLDRPIAQASLSEADYDQNRRNVRVILPYTLADGPGIQLQSISTNADKPNQDE
ncbi:DUF2865 domain-containing protein [Ensifer sp. SL37]|uniref:DUF2865 domain-containing protein n=1 Tax=Ensifer sp. SL37 TaxID=2995137 RepID=UPI002276AB70|nr:DUF2865 domain-containing protein [Ensifer sp. SL37]MCY1740871.1 DUF2865 domain-containing protein [Ensifer sp. SL37]